MSDERMTALPMGWVRTTIENLFWPLEDGRTLHQGWSPQCEKSPAATDDDWGVLKTTSIQAGSFHSEHNKNLPAHLKPRPQIEVKPGDFLITCAGPRVRCGVACLVRATRPRLMMSGKMYRFRVPPEFVDARFLEAYLLTQEATTAIDKMKTGGSDSGLNLTHDRFRPLSVPVAPLSEQQRIMDTLDELLSDLDAGVAALERVRAKLKHYRASVLKAAVDGALTAEWRRQHPATETACALLARILAERRRRWEEMQLAKFESAGRSPPKDWNAKYVEPVAADADKVAALPDGWHWVSIDECIVSPVVNGISIKGSDTPPGVASLRLSAMTDSGFDYSERRYLPLSPKDVDDLWIRACDFFVCRGNGSKKLVGRGTLAQDPKEDVIFPDTMMRLRLSSILVGTRWISTIWSSTIVRRQIEKSAKTTAGIWKIAQPDLTTIIIPLPPKAEQVAIVEAVEEQLSLIDYLERDLETRLKGAQALRQSILRHAFTGQLVPQDPDDEPASELLSRIAGEREERSRLLRAAKQTKPKTKAPRRRATKD